MGKSINALEETHAGVSRLAHKLQYDGVPTNIGDVADHLWKFVEKNHLDEFKEYVLENVSQR